MLNTSKHFIEAKESVFLSGEILKKYYAKSPQYVETAYKGEKDPVTIADKTSEKTIIKHLKKKFPTVQFLCEESCNSTQIKDGHLVWILDPLDGTVNFVHKLPLFSISLALCDGEDVLFGIVYNPITGEFFSAIKGCGAYLNGQKINVSEIKDIKHALLVTGFPYNFNKSYQEVMKHFQNFCHKATGIRRLGSAAIDLCYVATGYFDGFWEQGLNPWDVAAGSLIVKEAGGTVSDFSNKNNYLLGKTLIASNSKLHKQMVNIVNTNRR